jgi:hypothetical protein
MEMKRISTCSPTASWLVASCRSRGRHVGIGWSGLAPPPGRPNREMGCSHAAAQATEAAAPEATEAATAATRRIGGRTMHSYAATREAAMAAFAKSWQRE